MEQLRQRVIASYHLDAMDLEETREYIEHRLRLVGWNGDPGFTEGAHEVVYRYTGGVPRRINTFCDRMLLFAFLEEVHEINEELLEQVVEELSEESFEKTGNKEAALMCDVNKSWIAADSVDRCLMELEHRLSKVEGDMELARELLQRFLDKSY